jgi:hypothetical protein
LIRHDGFSSSNRSLARQSARTVAALIVHMCFDPNDVCFDPNDVCFGPNDVCFDQSRDRKGAVVAYLPTPVG